MGARWLPQEVPDSAQAQGPCGWMMWAVEAESKLCGTVPEALGVGAIVTTARMQGWSAQVCPPPSRSLCWCCGPAPRTRTPAVTTPALQTPLPLLPLFFFSFLPPSLTHSLLSPPLRSASLSSVLFPPSLPTFSLCSFSPFLLLSYPLSSSWPTFPSSPLLPSTNYFF